jgi:hypothetical protein
MPVFTAKRRRIVAAAVPTVLFTSVASAELLAPGGLDDVSDFATTLQQSPDLGGTLEARQLIPFNLADDNGTIFYTGQLMNAVVRDTQNNTLSFYYEFMNTPGDQIMGVDDLLTSSFKGYSTQVALLTDGAGDTGPIDASRSSNGANVIFDFDATASRILPGDRSFTFVLKTNATQFADNGSADVSGFIAASDDDGSPILAGGDASVATFRPSGGGSTGSGSVVVPLPPPVWTAIPTMVASIVWTRRQRKLQGHG